MNMTEARLSADVGDGPQEPLVWRVTGYFVGDPVAVDHVAARVYGDDASTVKIVSSLVVAPDREQAKELALRKGWLSPLVERFS